MSHGKETPRQKMINLMYLVLTCLLALNVTKDVLLGFVNINESLEVSNRNMKKNTDKILEAAQEAVKQGHHEVRPYIEKAKVVRTLSAKTIEYIDSLKKELVIYTEDIKGADTLTLAEVEKLDNYDKPTYMLIGPDETKPSKGLYTASELKARLQKFSDTLDRLVVHMHKTDGLRLPEKDYQALKNRISSFKPEKEYRDFEGNRISWEMKNYYNMPLAAVVTHLSKIQNDVGNLEGELVSSFASAAGKLAVNFNQMEANIVPTSLYVQKGDEYKANVFLSASSSEFTEDNLQFILGDVDTSTGALAPGSIILPMDQGKGRINIPASMVGHKEIKGWIKLRDGTGRLTYYRYNNQYLVANPAVAVSADKMNVFYAGVENPLTVSAAGVAPEDLIVNLSGANARIQNKGDGKYSVFVNGAGPALVSVFAKTPEGQRKQGSDIEFRVKKFPSPPLKILNRPVIGTINLGLSDAKSISQLGLDLSNMDFNAPFRVKKFAITMGGGGSGLQQFKCEGNQLSEPARIAFQRMKKGTVIYLEDIKVEAPDGEREIPMVKVLVK